MNKQLKKALLVLVSIFLSLCIVVGTSLIVNVIKTNIIDDDYSGIYSVSTYEAVEVSGVELVTQEVSCGYAVIEMFAKWSNKDITEESLYNEYGRVVTSTGMSFCDEFNKLFPEYDTTMYKYLTNTELINMVYESLSNGIVVPFEWAAKYQDTWTLHYSLIVGLDISNDKVTVYNPYGTIEEISIEEFISRTTFKAFDNMPLFYRLAFAFGIFEKNTVFIPTKK